MSPDPSDLPARGDDVAQRGSGDPRSNHAERGDASAAPDDRGHEPSASTGDPRRAWWSRVVLLIGVPLALLPLANVWPREQTLHVQLPQNSEPPVEVEISLLDADGDALSVSRRRVVDVRQPVVAQFKLIAGSYRVVVAIADGSTGRRQVHQRRVDFDGDVSSIRLGEAP